MKNIKRISDFFSAPTLLHYALPFLMIYLIIGTVAQKYIGLYEATKVFFSSPILWLGIVPLPGLPIIITLIFLNLCFKLFLKSPWKIQNAGVIVTHIGAIMLLLGGMFTAFFSNEGYIDLAPNETKNFVTDYHSREFVLLDDQNHEVAVFAHKDLYKEQSLSFSGLPFTVKIIDACRNCDIKARRFVQEEHRGMALHMELSNGKLHNEDEENMAGVTFSIEDSNEDGIYLVLENVPKQPTVIVHGKVYRFALQRQHRTMPFNIELIEFKRDMHPGTAMASAFQSRVRIIDGGAKWESVIRMNEPLRYKGYTFYQSSFFQTPQGDVSVLAVVWNVGRAFPYISGIAMCLGIILHLSVRGRKRKSDRKGDVVHAA